MIDDSTALNGPTVDVGARIGWVLRMARMSHAEAPGLDHVAGAVGTNITRLHRAETGSLRSGRLADGYESTLGLEPGTLRAPIDIACRTFPYAPADRDPGDPITSVREMSRLTEAVGGGGVTGGQVTGGQWLRWARALAQPGSIALPESTARELVTLLVAELSRATAHAYPSRYEALALVRCSGYGHVVLEVAEAELSDPHVQVAYDLMSAIGEAPTPDAVAWCLGLLGSERPRSVVGAALALEGMAEVSGDPAFWTALVGPLLDHFDRAAPGSVAHGWLSHLIRLVPRAVLTREGRRPGQPLAEGADITDWSRSRLNDHWSVCQDRAQEATTALGLADQPMLTRLLFEIAMGPHESRAVTSYMLLGAIPGMAAVVGPQVAEIADGHPDPVVRERAGRRLSGALHGHDHDIVDRWLASGTADQRERALRLAGAAGRTLPSSLLEGEPSEGVVYALGMTGHPALRRLARDASRSDDVRGAARWWLARGPRIVA